MSDLLLSPGGPVAPSRRSFFKRFGAGVGAVALVASGCDSGDDGDDNDADVTIDFSNDFGVLNYAFALEQLEAAFYAEAIRDSARLNAAFSSAAERMLLTDIAAHEGVHRDFLRAAIQQNGGTPLPNLTPNFGAVDFTSRASVLATARTFEDLGVAAYNGAGKRLTNRDFLTIAGKIVSVEARHAAAIRDVLQPFSPASVGEAGGGLPEVVMANGLDVAMEPGAVLAAAQPFIRETIGTRNL